MMRRKNSRIASSAHGERERDTEIGVAAVPIV
jgi:hypothetical protein